MMNQAEAWTHLASCWDNPDVSFNGYYGVGAAPWHSLGLCSSIEFLYTNAALTPPSPLIISREVRGAMLRTLEAHDPQAYSEGAYFWRLRDIEGAQSRAAFCHQSAIALDPITNTDKE